MPHGRQKSQDSKRIMFARCWVGGDTAGIEQRVFRADNYLG